VAGKLWDAAPVTVEQYGAAVQATAPRMEAGRGLVTAVMPVADLEGLSKRLEGDRKLFEGLRGEAVRRTFGYKVLAYPALVGFLARELGVKTVVLVPQEMADGLIVERLVPHSLADSGPP
jgi:hypothetical protein